jgi:CO/xanthine dehydrogenase FAD-binding subunit
MPNWKEYHLARDINEALTYVQSTKKLCSWVAGGTDLLLDIQQGRHESVHTLIDVTAIPELGVIELRGDYLYVGAAVPLKRIVDSPLVLRYAQSLNEAARLIGGPQIRNVATLGGNIGHALPAADGAISLLALGARAEIISQQGQRLVSIEELYLGPGESALTPNHELLIGFRIPIYNHNGGNVGVGSAFQRVMRPQGVAIAILNMGVWLKRQEEQIIDVRLAAGPAGPTPRRLQQTEDYLRGKEFTNEIMAEGYQAMLEEANFRTSAHRSTSEYRRYLAGVLLKNVLTIAWQRATV